MSSYVGATVTFVGRRRSLSIKPNVNILGGKGIESEVTWEIFVLMDAMIDCNTLRAIENFTLSFYGDMKVGLK